MKGFKGGLRLVLYKKRIITSPRQWGEGRSHHSELKSFHPYPTNVENRVSS